MVVDEEVTIVEEEEESICRVVVDEEVKIVEEDEAEV